MKEEEKKKTLKKLIIMVIFNMVTLNPFTSRLASYGEIICHYLLPVLIKTYSVTTDRSPYKSKSKESKKRKHLLIQL